MVGPVPTSHAPGGIRLIGRWCGVVSLFAWSTFGIVDVGADLYSVAAGGSTQRRAVPLSARAVTLLELLGAPLKLRSGGTILATIGRSGPVRSSTLDAAQGHHQTFSWLLDPIGETFVVSPTAGESTSLVVAVRPDRERSVLVLVRELPDGGRLRIVIQGVERPRVHVGQFVVGGQRLGEFSVGRDDPRGLSVDIDLVSPGRLIIGARRGGVLYRSGSLAYLLPAMPRPQRRAGTLSA
jgi:hypothetical protein